jgi:hypothetical protein
LTCICIPHYRHHRCCHHLYRRPHSWSPVVIIIVGRRHLLCVVRHRHRHYRH